jgi:hypothetical protein
VQKRASRRGGRRSVVVPYARGRTTSSTGIVDEIRWDEKAGLGRDAVGSQIIDALEAQEIKETGDEED